jgi:hypothetical protein
MHNARKAAPALQGKITEQAAAPAAAAPRMGATYWIPGTPITGQQAEAEAARLISTIALAEEALRIAADHRSERHALGETMEETRDRWNEAFAIEEAAIACRKAARKALADLRVFPDKRSPDEIASRIHLARCAALALKRACDAGQESAQRRRVGIAERQNGGSR